MSGWSRGAVLAGALALTAACGQNNHEAVLDDYLTRIARVTGGEAAVPGPEPLPPYPARRALALDIPRQTIDVAELFELHGCDMGALVGFRNSPLGRVQADSQRLGYEAEWLAAVERCGDQADDWIVELGADKRRWLPALFWNATFAQDEMRIALGASGREARGDLAHVLRGLNDSLTALQAGEFDLRAFERLLNQLRQGSWLGPARRDWSRWRRYLGAGSLLLEQSVPGICLNRQPTTATRRLNNVFLAFYVERIQPELARGMGDHRDDLVALERLSERLTAVQPDEYRVWFRAVVSAEHAESEWRRTRAAVLEHVEAWKTVFSHCNVEPVPGLGQD